MAIEVIPVNGQLGKPAPGVPCDNVWAGGSNCGGTGVGYEPPYPIDWNPNFPGNWTRKGKRWVQNPILPIIVPPTPTPTPTPAPVEDDLVFGLVTTQTAWIIGGVAATGVLLYAISQMGGK